MTNSGSATCGLCRASLPSKDVHETKEFFEYYGIPTQIAGSLAPPAEVAGPSGATAEQFADDDAPVLPEA